MPLMCDVPRRVGRYSMILVFWYLAVYVLLMDWRYSDPYFAYDMATGQLVDCSGYRMVCTVPYRPEGGVTTCGPCVCLPNRVFRPLIGWCAVRWLLSRPNPAFWCDARRPLMERGPLSHLPASGSAPAEAHARGFPAMTGKSRPMTASLCASLCRTRVAARRAVQPPRQA